MSISLSPISREPAADRLEIDQGFDCVSWLGHAVTTLFKQPIAIYNWAISFFASHESPSHHILRAVQRMGLRGAPPAETCDPSLQQLQTFVTNVSTLIGDSVYDQALQPAIANYTNSLQSMSQDISKWEFVTNAIAKAIAGELVQIIASASSDTMSLAKMSLSWLVFGTDKSQLQKMLSQKYASQLASQPGLVDRFLDWLWNSAEGAIPPLESLGSTIKDIILSLLISSLQKLIDNKVEQLIHYLEKVVEGDVQTFMRQLFVQNSTIIGQIVGARLAELLQGTAPLNPPDGLPTIYQQSYDQILKIAQDHVQAIIIANKQKTQTQFEKSFSQSEACDPNVRLMANPPKGVDPTIYRDSIELKLCQQTAKLLLALLLPDQTTTKNGFVITTPGVITLLKQLKAPPLLKSAFEMMLQLPKELFANGVPPTVDELFKALGYFCERAVAAIANDQIENGVAFGLKLATNYVVPPQFLYMWMARGANPALFQALSQALLCLVLADPSDEVANAFLHLAAPNCNRAQVEATLSPYLYNLVQSCCKDLPLATAGITQEAFLQSITPLLNQIATCLVQNQAKSSAEVKSTLKACVKPINSTTNSTYGAIARGLACDIGGLKILGNDTITQALVDLVLQNLMSRALTIAIYPLWQNEQIVVSGLVSALQGALSTQKQVDTLIFGPPLVPVDVSQQLNQQYTQMASLLHAILNMVIDQIPNNSDAASGILKHLSADALKKLLPAKSNLATAIKSNFTTVIGNRLVNESIFLKTLNVMVKGLQDSNIMLQTSQN